jgi:hypothetical protein
MIAKKSEYGEVDECCLEEMYAKVKLIKRLDCYCFPKLESISTTTNGVEIYEANNVDLQDSKFWRLYSTSYEQVNATGVIAKYFSDGTKTFAGILQALLNLTDLTYTTEIDGDNVIITVSTTCLLNGIYGDSRAIFEVESSPVCSYVDTECYNCVEDSDLPKMYEVLKKLGK